MVDEEGRVELDRQHVEGAFELILHGNALAEGWCEGQGSVVNQALVVNCLLNLIYSDLVLPTLVPLYSHLAISLADHRIIVHLKLVVEQNVRSNLFNDVVFDQDQTVDLDVDCEAVGVEARADFFVDFDEDVVGWLLDGAFAVLL